MFLGLGANLGDRGAALARAAALLASSGALAELRASPLYETEPLEAPGAAASRSPSPWYLNQVVRGTTALAPRELLAATQAVERAAGRAEERARWAPRELDVDILLYGGLTVAEEGLAIPHPGLTSRRFVLEPLALLAPDLVVPGTGRTVSDHLAALDDPRRVILYPHRGDDSA